MANGIVEESNARVDGRTKQVQRTSCKVRGSVRLRREENLNKEGSKEEYTKFFNAMKSLGFDSSC